MHTFFRCEKWIASRWDVASGVRLERDGLLCVVEI